MRRLPVFVMVDVSESMAGDAITSMHNGLQSLHQALMKDPQVIEIGVISIISFGATAKVEVPLESVLDIRIPSLDLSSGTSLGAAFDLLTSEINSRVMKTTHEVRGDYKPVIFLITDGQPTDNWRKGFTKFRKYYPSLTVHAIGCGGDVDFSILREITQNTYMLKDMSAEAFGKLFQCVTASVRSVTASMMNGDNVKDDLTEWTDGTVCKPSEEECRPMGESRQVMIPAVCALTKRHYLLRYRLQEDGMYLCMAAHPLERKLEGAGSKAGEIVASRMGAAKPCPHCGSDSVVFCRKCGTLSCMDSHSETMICPTCGLRGNVTRSSDFSVNRSRG